MPWRWRYERMDQKRKTLGTYEGSRWSSDALVTAGWERPMKTIGPEAKAVKTEIITQWVSLPTDIADTLAMASPMAAL